MESYNIALFLGLWIAAFILTRLGLSRMFKLAGQLNKFELALRLKCEICRPKLLGHPGNYPVCSKHETKRDVV